MKTLTRAIELSYPSTPGHPSLESWPGGSFLTSKARGKVSSIIVLLLQSARPATERPRTPDLENSRKTAEKGAEWAPGKVPLFFGCLAGCPVAFLAVFLHFAPGPTRNLFRLFSGCFHPSVAGRADCNPSLPRCVVQQEGREENNTPCATLPKTIPSKER